jgi:hypothetical protein
MDRHLTTFSHCVHTIISVSKQVRTLVERAGGDYKE